MRISGSKLTLEQFLLAGCFDTLRILAWQNTKDGHRGSNKPPSILEELTKEKPEKDQLIAFRSGDDFMAAWDRLCRGY